MSDYESDDEGQPIERRPSRRYAPRGNVPISDHEPQRTPPILAQVHSQIQPAEPQRSTPPQNRYSTAHVRQHPSDGPSGVASDQQYHGDTFRRSTSDGEAQLSHENHHGRSPDFAPYHHRFQHIRRSVDQYSTRADSGSDVQVNATHITPSGRQTGNALTTIYGRNWMDPELQTVQVYRDSANPVSDPNSIAGGYRYSPTLDLPTGPHNQVYNPYYTSTRCPHGCPTPPGYHCHHTRERR